MMEVGRCDNQEIFQMNEDAIWVFVDEVALLNEWQSHKASQW